MRVILLLFVVLVLLACVGCGGSGSSSSGSEYKLEVQGVKPHKYGYRYEVRVSKSGVTLTKDQYQLVPTAGPSGFHTTNGPGEWAFYDLSPVDADCKFSLCPPGAANTPWLANIRVHIETGPTFSVHIKVTKAGAPWQDEPVSIDLASGLRLGDGFIHTDAHGEATYRVPMNSPSVTIGINSTQWVNYNGRSFGLPPGESYGVAVIPIPVQPAGGGVEMDLTFVQS